MKITKLVQELVEVLAERGDLEVIVGFQKSDRDWVDQPLDMVVPYSDGTVGVVGRSEEEDEA